MGSIRNELANELKSNMQKKGKCRLRKELIGRLYKNPAMQQVIANS
jgi:hypothetical protein